MEIKNAGYFSIMLGLFLIMSCISSGLAADTVSVGTYSGCAGDQIQAIITIQNDDSSLDAFGFDLAYCTDMLAFSSYQVGGLTAGWSNLEASVLTPGTVRAGGFTLGAPIPSGSNGSIIIITFDVTCGACQLGDICNLDIFNPVDDIVSWTIVDGTFENTCEGPTPTATEPISTSTATVVPNTPTPEPTFTPGIDRLWIDDASGCTGGQIQVAVRLSNPVTSPITDFGFDFAFDSAMLQYDSCQKGDLISDWLFFGCNPIGSGVVRVGGFHTTGLPADSVGSIAILTFTITCGACSEGDSSALSAMNLVDGIQGFPVTTGLFTYSCVATVTPTPTLTPIPPRDRISVGSLSGCNDDMIQIPITINNPDTPVEAWGFDLLYDANMIQYINCAPGELIETWQYFECNTIAPGHIRVGAFGPPPIPAGSLGAIALLNFQVMCASCNEGDQSALNLTDLVDDISGWNTVSGIFTYACLVTPTPTPTLQDRIWIADSSGCEGDAVEVVINIDNPDMAVGAFGFDLQFCNSMLQFDSCRAGDLTSGWTFFGCNQIAPDVVRVGGFSEISMPQGSIGSVAILTFIVNCPGCFENETCTLSFSNLVDDIINWAADSGDFAYSCIVTPTPTPTATPQSDFIIVGEAIGCTGDEIIIPVNIENPVTPIESFGFDMQFCSSMMQYSSCEAGDLTNTWDYFACNEIAPDLVRVGGFSVDPIPVGSRGTLVLLHFVVTCGTCVDGDTCILPLVELVDDISTFTLDDGLFTFTCAVTPTPTETPAPQNFIIVGDGSGCTGDRVEIPVNIDNQTMPVDALGFDLYFDSNALQYDSCLAGDLTLSWPFFGCNQIAPGHIRVGGFSIDPIPAGSQGSIVFLTFFVTCSGCPEGAVSSLTLSDLIDDLEYFGIDNGAFTYTCPEPTPTETPFDTPTDVPTDTPTEIPTQTPTLEPTSTPSPLPTNTPITPPTNTPVSPPTNTPVSPPTNTPVSPPTNTPVSPPTNTPVNPPTNTPVSPPTNTPVSPPTNTPVSPPTNTPVSPPTNTPVNPPTSTPVNPPSYTPAPTSTPQPSATPDCLTTGTRIEMPSHMYAPGDICWIRVLVCNLEGETLQNIPFFFVLDIYGAYWFWPTWTEVGIDYDQRSFIDGLTIIYIIGEFQWPEFSPSANGIFLYSAMVEPDFSDLIGELGMFEFGWTQ